jgi:hypothetical protein
MCYAVPMSWSFKIAPPIILKDGRKLETLADARAFILALPGRQSESSHLKLAVQMLDEASRDWMLVWETGEQISDALKAEGLI